MLDIDLLFKIGAMGILLFVIDKVLKASGKEEYAAIANIVGIVIVLISIVGLVIKLFSTVRTMFML